MIRQATKEDVCRIAEILVFVKRVNFFPIFQDEVYSFKEVNVFDIANDIKDYLHEIYVYDDGVIKGLIRVKNQEVVTLYVEPFFTSKGIGHQLLEFALKQFHVTHLYCLEKNTRALSFYERHDFKYHGIWKYEEDTTEKLLLLEVS